MPSARGDCVGHRSDPPCCAWNGDQSTRPCDVQSLHTRIHLKRWNLTVECLLTSNVLNRAGSPSWVISAASYAIGREQPRRTGGVPVHPATPTRDGHLDLLSSGSPSSDASSRVERHASTRRLQPLRASRPPELGRAQGSRFSRPRLAANVANGNRSTKCIVSRAFVRVMRHRSPSRTRSIDSSSLRVSSD